MSNYSIIKDYCTSNGPGVRTVIYLSGCTLKCKGCFNYELWDFDAGAPVTDEVVQKLIESLEPEYIQGLSILGGEPMDPKNQETTLKLAKAIKDAYGDKKDVWVWTGYIVGESLPSTSFTNDIFKYVDVIVDGPFMMELQDATLPYFGSKNQRLLMRGRDF